MSVILSFSAGSSAPPQTASEEVAVESGLPTAAGLVEERGDPGASSSAQQLAGERQGPTQLPEFITERVRDARSGNAVVGALCTHPEFMTADQLNRPVTSGGCVIACVQAST